MQVLVPQKPNAAVAHFKAALPESHRRPDTNESSAAEDFKSNLDRKLAGEVKMRETKPLSGK